MLLFSTLLSIRPSMQVHDFIRLVIEWNQGSPHKENVIKDILWDGSHTACFGNEKLRLCFIELCSEKEHSVAARYQKIDENGAVWITDYVMNFKTRKMSIRLDRTYLEEALALDGEFSTPHFITLLINKGYLEDDAGIPVLRTPLTVDMLGEEILLRVTNGNFSGKLPLVYVRKDEAGCFPVDIGLLASRLKGVAHVYVEDYLSSDDMPEDIARDKQHWCTKISDMVPQGGIRIYYPRGNISKTYTRPRGLDEDSILMEKVVRAVIQYSNIQDIDANYTWTGVEQAILIDELEAKREELQKVKSNKDTSDELTSFIEMYDEEIKRWQAKIGVLMTDNERLNDENKRLKTKINETDGMSLLMSGSEKEYYPDEIKDFVLAALEKEARLLNADGRRLHILTDIIENNGYERIVEQRINRLKSIMGTYDGMSKKIRKALTDLGFVITEDGKHYKLTYYGDDRYVVVIAKTPSDKQRAGMNNVSEIRKKVF